MKNLFFTILFYSFFSTLQAQDYQPMAIEGAHWIIFRIPDGIDWGHEAIVIRGDSTVNGLIYKKVFAQDIVNEEYDESQFMPPFYLGEEIFVGLVRDDTLSEKVYGIGIGAWLGCSLDEPELLYDFALEAGDTVSGCMHIPPAGNFPLTVDSLFAVNIWGTNRQVQEVELGRFIEGIGTDLGPFGSLWYFPHPGSPSFLYDYCVGTDEQCNLFPVTAGETAVSSAFKIFPNPANGFLKIELPGDDGQEAFTVILSDITGKMYRKETYSGALNLQDLPGGIYLLTVQTSEKTQTRKFLKRS